MLTRCPQCQTVHPLEADRAEGGDKRFVCPACGNTFDPFAHLTDAPEAHAELEEPQPQEHSEDAEAPEEQGQLFGPRPRPRAAPLPRFARQRVRLPRPAQLRWWLVSGGLLLLLVGLVPIADRDRLATDARWRPMLESMCGVLQCSLPPWRELKAFKYTGDVRRHPSVPNALLISVSLRNDAHFAQAWPLLELRMSDLDGRDVDLRRFRPQEYLGGVAHGSTIQPMQSVNATLEVVDPGRDAVNWVFDVY